MIATADRLWLTLPLQEELLGEISFWVPGRPEFKRRGRADIKKGGDGKPVPFVWNPEENRRAEEHIRECFTRAMVDSPVMEHLPHGGPVVMWIFARFLPGASTWEGKHRTERVDLDNIGKIEMDSLNGVAWKDDAQVVGLHLEKSYGPVEGTRIILRFYAETPRPGRIPV